MPVTKELQTFNSQVIAGKTFSRNSSPKGAVVPIFMIIKLLNLVNTGVPGLLRPHLANTESIPGSLPYHPLSSREISFSTTRGRKKKSLRSRLGSFSLVPRVFQALKAKMAELCARLLSRNKLRNLQCIMVARQVTRTCCPYYLTCRK